MHPRGQRARAWIYDPPEPYETKARPGDVLQNGNRIGGTLCAREVGLTL